MNSRLKWIVLIAAAALLCANAAYAQGTPGGLGLVMAAL